MSLTLHLRPGESSIFVWLELQHGASAKELNVSPQAVSKWENINYPEYLAVARSCALLGVSVDELS